MARRAAAAGRPSQRQLRVGEELRHVLAELLTRGHWREPALADAPFTVSEVRISADLRHAVVFVTEPGAEPVTSTEKLQLEPTGIVPPTRLTLCEPGPAVIVPAAANAFGIFWMSRLIKVEV